MFSIIPVAMYLAHTHRSSRPSSTLPSLKETLSCSRPPERSERNDPAYIYVLGCSCCSSVHLLGNYIDQNPDELDSDSEYDSEYDDYSDLIGSDEDEDEDIDGPYVPVLRASGRGLNKSSTIEEIDTVAEIAALPKKVKAAPVKAETKPSAVKAESKPVKAESKPAAAPAPVVNGASKRKAEDAGDVSMTSATSEMSKNQKKKLAKKAKLGGGSEAATTEAAAPAPVKPAPKPAANGQSQKVRK